MNLLNLILLIVGFILIAWSCIIIHNVFLLDHPTHEIVPAIIGTFIGTVCLVGALMLQTTSEDTEYYTKTNQYKLADVTLIKKNTGEKTVIDTSRYNVLVASGEHQEITKLKETLASSEIIINKTEERLKIDEIHEKANIKEPIIKIKTKMAKNKKTKETWTQDTTCILIVPQESTDKIIEQGHNGN